MRVRPLQTNPYLCISADYTAGLNTEADANQKNNQTLNCVGYGLQAQAGVQMTKN